MKKLIILLLFIPLIQPIMAQDTPVLSKVSDLEQKIDALVKQYQDLDLFAGVVLVSERGTPLFHKAFGYADRENKRKNTIDTKFDIGSMNKAFTKVVVIKLA